MYISSESSCFLTSRTQSLEGAGQAQEMGHRKVVGGSSVATRVGEVVGKFWGPLQLCALLQLM